ncbi:MAG: hypothetical protein WCL38_06855, partial [Actinomycetota bacterium]
NARLAARLTGWRIDIKSETQLQEEEDGWAEGEWIEDESGQQVWVPAEGGEAITATEWNSGSTIADAPTPVESTTEEISAGDETEPESPDADEATVSDEGGAE